jgi:hypothetical protein
MNGSDSDFCLEKSLSFFTERNLCPMNIFVTDVTIGLEEIFQKSFSNRVRSADHRARLAPVNDLIYKHFLSYRVNSM